MKDDPNILVLITTQYPYGYQEPFLENELPFLLQCFSKVVIIPLHKTKTRRKTPKGVEVISSLADRNRLNTPLDYLKKVICCFSKPYIYQEIIKRPKVLFHWKSLRSLIGYTSYMIAGIDEIKLLIEKRPELKKALFYAYWLYIHASILVFLKKKSISSLKIIARAHGYDIYEECYQPPFIPYRKVTLELIDHIFSISKDGMEHLIDVKHLTQEKISVSHLGVPKQKMMAKRSSKGHFSIVSCSYLISLKRVNKIIEGIAYLSKQFPEMVISWNHLGGGELYDDLKKMAFHHFPKNVVWKMHGNLENCEVYDFYQKHPVDVFVSASETEGVPVSMMEAISFGVPIVATDVGGVSEVVKKTHGILLKREVSAKEIAEALCFFIKNENSIDQFKSSAKKHWQACFDQEINYQKFAFTLKKMILSSDK